MDPEILNGVLDGVQEPVMPAGFRRLRNPLQLSAIPTNPLPIVILMKTETEAQVLTSVIREISVRYDLRVSVCTFTSAYEALFYMEQPCTRNTTVCTFDTLDRVHIETTISQRGETSHVNALKARAMIMDEEFSHDPDMRRVLDAGGLLEVMVILLSSEETLALQMSAAPTRLHEDPPPRELSIFRFGFNEEPGQLLPPVVRTILRSFMSELVNWLRSHSPMRPPIEG